MIRCKLDEHSLNINVLNINNHSTHNCSMIRINIHNNNTLYKGGVEMFDAKDNNKEEEDLVMEETK